MRVLAFGNSLGLGGTEKAACRWAKALHNRGHQVHFVSLEAGPRRSELEESGVTVEIATSRSAIGDVLRRFQPEVIHAHAPGVPHPGDLLGEALRETGKIPVVQTNIFGRLQNPSEDRWVDFRLFISWTSCVQAARRSKQPLDERFFERSSVAVYPLDPDDGPSQHERESFRRDLGIQEDEIVLGRLSRPEPNKWTNLPLRAFRLAAPSNPKLRLLLREAPPLVAEELRRAPDAARFILLPATHVQDQIRQTLGALDVVLHTSSIGESFGYGIAEPMNFGKPVITNSVPWLDQAQIELIRPNEGGLLASTPRSMARAIRLLSKEADLRRTMGEQAQRNIRDIADPERSIDRLEQALSTVIAGGSNPNISQDISKAQDVARYLDQYQFGKGFGETAVLRGYLTYLRAKAVFYRLRRLVQ